MIWENLVSDQLFTRFYNLKLDSLYWFLNIEKVGKVNQLDKL